MPKTRSNNLQMYYEVNETGIPVVLISGLTGDHFAWALQAPELRAAPRWAAWLRRKSGSTIRSAR